MEKDIDKICSEISEKQGIPFPIVKHVVSHQFNFVRQTMENDLLSNILLHNFGSFKVKKQRIDSLIRSLIKKISGIQRGYRFTYLILIITFCSI